MVFDVVIVEHPSKKDAEENGTLEKLIAGPHVVVARDAQAAAISAAMDLKDVKIEDRSRIQVFVRPFA